MFVLILLITLTLLSFNTHQKECNNYEVFFSESPCSARFPFGDEFLNHDIKDHQMPKDLTFNNQTGKSCCFACPPVPPEPPVEELRLYNDDICKKCDIKTFRSAFIIECFMCTSVGGAPPVTNENLVFLVDFIEIANYTSDPDE